MERMESFVDIEYLTMAHDIYHFTLEGEWCKVVLAYKDKENIHTMPINRSGDTALFVAANDNKSYAVQQLVGEIKNKAAESLMDVLKQKNVSGDTALHCAASIGSLQMCECITEADHHRHQGHVLIEERNNNGETPLFLAALNGHKHVFFYLQSRCADKSLGPCRRASDGLTVLHCTLSRDYFALSFEIIHMYDKEIVGSVDEKGITPLHILADKPSAFESSSNFRWCTKLAYKSLPERKADAENPSDYINEYRRVPPNYWTCCDIFITYFIGLVLEAFGLLRILKSLWKKKQKHVWCALILDELWKHKNEAYIGGGLKAFWISKPSCTANDDRKEEDKSEQGKDESALFIAAKNGVLEILKKILKDKPGSIHETNSLDQNVLHVAVENRQPHVFKLLTKHLREKMLWENFAGRVDKNGNTVLHLAAQFSSCKPWHIAGSALQMQWQVKWSLFMKENTPHHLRFLQNHSNETPQDIFVSAHKDLVKEGTDWLKSTSESCSVVAVLIAGVAFATATAIPGGTQEETGKPNLQHHPAFNLFAFTSLLALCCSITSLIMFLSILTSRQQPRDFRRDLPLKLLLGLSCLFMSIALVLVSFSAAFFFLLKDNLQQVVFPLYAVTILPVTFFGVAQLPLYIDLVRAIFLKVPQSCNRESEKLILLDSYH